MIGKQYIGAWMIHIRAGTKAYSVLYEDYPTKEILNYHITYCRRFI